MPAVRIAECRSNRGGTRHIRFRFREASVRVGTAKSPQLPTEGNCGPPARGWVQDPFLITHKRDLRPIAPLPQPLHSDPKDGSAVPLQSSADTNAVLRRCFSFLWVMLVADFSPGSRLISRSTLQESRVSPLPRGFCGIVPLTNPRKSSILSMP